MGEQLGVVARLYLQAYSTTLPPNPYSNQTGQKLDGTRIQNNQNEPAETKVRCRPDVSSALLASSARAGPPVRVLSKDRNYTSNKDLGFRV